MASAYVKTVVAAGHGHSSHGKDLVGTTWRSLRQVLRSSISRCFGYGSRLESILCSLQGLYLDGITKYYSEFYDRRVQESATSLHRKSQYLSDPRAPVPHPGRISTLDISREGVNLCKLQRVERSKVKKLNDCEYYRIKACMTSTKKVHHTFLSASEAGALGKSRPGVARIFSYSSRM